MHINILIVFLFFVQAVTSNSQSSDDGNHHHNNKQACSASASSSSALMSVECSFISCRAARVAQPLQPPEAPFSLQLDSSSSSNKHVPLGEDFTLQQDEYIRKINSSISDRTDYPKACAAAATDDIAFSGFLNEPTYQMILGGLGQRHGSEYLNRIQELGVEILDCLPQFKTMDLVGNPPNIFWYGTSVGFISSLTLRYVHVLLELSNTFGSLNGFNIAEIGGGFGGQAKIISDVFQVASYTIVDIPEALALTSRFLDHFPRIKSRSVLLAAFDKDLTEGVTGHSLDDDSHLVDTYDLCLSIYAFTELALEPRNRYWDKILKRCKRGYIIDNSKCQHDDDVVQGDTVFGCDELAKRLREQYHRNVHFELEVPQTGCHNRVMTWK